MKKIKLLTIIKDAENVCYGEGIGPSEEEFNLLRFLVTEIPADVFERIFKELEELPEWNG